jgi:hypothetical protein
MLPSLAHPFASRSAIEPTSWSFNNRFPLPADRFDAASRSADFKFSAPDRAMKTGAYLLTFEAQLGTLSVQGQVKFTYR